MQKEIETEGKPVKCLIWDLDNTLWDGTLLEGSARPVSEGVRRVVATLDGRGILQSIASRNAPEAAQQRLRDQGLSEYFLYPQIGWGAKSTAVQAIAARLNLGLDALAFVDDDPFERAEVATALPPVRCLDARDIPGILQRPEMNPRWLTEDARNRRKMYLQDQARATAEESFQGPTDEFLASLNMTFVIERCSTSDLQRAEELTVRTNQLNATGRTYSYDELDAFRRSDRHLLLVASLQDRFGSYGKIGLTLVECLPDRWTLKLMLMSCRVMSRGVGTIMLNHVQRQARQARVRLLADFVPTDRNRMMYVTYKFAGFKEIENSGGLVTLESPLSDIAPDPTFIGVQVRD
jgi:FkbH-like protein